MFLNGNEQSIGGEVDDRVSNPYKYHAEKDKRDTQ